MAAEHRSPGTRSRICRVKSLIANVALVCFGIVVSIALAEGLARAWYGESRLVNFALERQSLLQSAYPAEFHPELGYRPRQGVQRQNPWDTLVTIGTHGIRENGRSAPVDSDKLILAVGDSFTFGDQVNDSDTWPAILENLLQIRVLNGGVFGYGIDQSVMRTEELASLYSPDVVLLSLIPVNIDRTELIVRAGIEKPVFDVTDDQLRRINPVLMPEPMATGWLLPVLRQIFGYSFMAHKIAGRLFPDAWYAGRTNKRLHNNGVAVSCKFLERFSAIDAERKLVLVQYWLGEIDRHERPDNVIRLLECAKNLNLETLDLYAGFERISNEDPERIESFFFGRDYGHMTVTGNAYVAREVADFLSQVPSR